ncbi:MAG: valine--tRNA ligase [Actinomycetota bacterium]|nr:valine--tRNA ligase [Actinomycetota bacterium]
MIVRLMNEAQYRIDESILAELNALDDRATAALEANDETQLDQRLDEMFELVRSRGERLPDDDLSASDLIIPPSDLTLEETRELMTHEGLIPDIPVG